MDKITNNLFLLVANLSQRKDKQAIIRLFIQGLNSFLPHIFFSWQEEADSDALIEVSTQNKIYGEVKISESDLKNDPIALASIQNAAQMLAIILERLEQEKILNDEKKHLESIVQDRTIQLKNQVQEYEALYEEYKSLNDQLKDSLDRIETNEGQLRSILENSTNVFYRHDTRHRLTYLSPQIETTLGYTPEEAKIKWTGMVTENPLNQRGYELTMKAIETGIPQQPYELELISKSGKKVYVEVREAPVVKDGKTTAIVGVLVDITERKKTQEKLLQNRFYLKKAQEMGKIGTWELDIKNDDYYWTEENYKIFGIKKGAKLNMEAVFRLIHPYERDLVNEKWKTGLINGSYEADFRLLLDNRIKWVNQKADIEFNSKGEAVKAVGFTQDITEQKKAEAKIHESEERYRLLYQNAGIGVGYYNPAGEVIELNEIALNHIQKTQKEVTGKKLHDLFPKQEADVYLKRILNTISKNKTQQFEDVIKVRNKNRWFLSAYSCVKDINGKVTGVQIMSMEITKLKQAEIRLRKSEEKFKSYIKNAPDGIFIINSKGEFREMNAEACAMTGYQSNELQKMNLMQLTPAETHKKAQQELCRLAENGIIRTELPYITSSGDKKFWSIDAVRLSDDNYIAFKKDVTEKIQHEQKISEQNEELEKSLHQLQQTTRELQIAKEKAEESDRLKTAFLANMSHEIRTPMNGILGFIDLLQSVEVPARERIECLKMMEQSGDRLLNTINDIMEISKIEAGQATLQTNQTNVNEVLGYIYHFFSPEAKGKGLKFKLTNKLDKDFRIITDRAKLESVLFNLIKNAIKFTAEGEINFGVFKKGKKLTFFVSDTGPGIPENRINAVFDRFVQADLKISRPYEGSGLGLSIAKAYSEMLGGKINVKSEVGKGSTFYFIV